MTRHSMMMPCRTGAAAFAACPARWMARARRLGFGVVAILAIAGSAGQAADERFEVTSVKAVRAPLCRHRRCIGAAQRRRVPRTAFDADDFAGNEHRGLHQHPQQGTLRRSSSTPTRPGSPRRWSVRARYHRRCSDAEDDARQVRRAIGLCEHGTAAQSALRRCRAVAHRARPSARGGAGPQGGQRRQGAEILRSVRRELGQHRGSRQGALGRQLRRRRERHDRDRAGADARQARRRQGERLGQRRHGQVQCEPRRGGERGAEPAEGK